MTDSSPPFVFTALDKDADNPLSALSIWAVALAIFSILTFGLTSLPAVVCAHLSLAAPERPASGVWERRVAVAGLMVGYLGLALLSTWILVVTGHLFLP